MPRLSARRRRRLIKLGSVLVLLLAVAPQVLYLGHPRSADDSSSAAQAVPPGHEAHAKAAAKHANHCHVGPKGCASSDGVVQVASFGTAIEILQHSGSVSAVESTPLPRSFVLWHRPEKPPQPV
jgi:hypothetical protein